MNRLWQDMLDILKAPFTGELDTTHILALIGLVLVIAAAWWLVLEHIRLGASVEV